MRNRYQRNCKTGFPSVCMFLWILLVRQCMSGTVTSGSKRIPAWDGYTNYERLEWQVITSSRLLCVAECMKDNRCVSVFYDGFISQCQGHSKTFGQNYSIITSQPGSTYFVLNRGHQYIGDDCVTSSECITLNADCRQGQCLCEAGYSFSPDTRSCQIGCTEYGSYFTVTPDHFISGYNEETILQVSLEECRAACISGTNYTCRSLEYEIYTGKCMLQQVSRFDASSSWHWDSNQIHNSHYNQRECL